MFATLTAMSFGSPKKAGAVAICRRFYDLRRMNSFGIKPAFSGGAAIGMSEVFPAMSNSTGKPECRIAVERKGGPGNLVGALLFTL